jgi:ABC-type iron transport system FetAB permease component
MHMRDGQFLTILGLSISFLSFAFLSCLRQSRAVAATGLTACALLLIGVTLSYFFHHAHGALVLESVGIAFALTSILLSIRSLMKARQS